MMKHDISIETFLEQLGSATPTPGGGAAAALTSALGTSLIMMVNNNTIKKNKCGEYEELIVKARDEAQELKGHLTQCIEEDAEAYNIVAAVYRMPRSIRGYENLSDAMDMINSIEADTDKSAHLERLRYAAGIIGEKGKLSELPAALLDLLDAGYKDTRSVLLAATSLRASEVPLSVMEDSLRALKIAHDMIGKTYKPLESDLRTAQRCLHSGILSSRSIVDANLPAIYKEDAETAERIYKRAEEIIREAGDIVHSYKD